MSRLIALLLAGGLLVSPAEAAPPAPAGSNPIIRDKFTADPAPLVVGDRLYLYVGHDEAQRDEMFNMREWLVYSTADMKHWTDHERGRFQVGEEGRLGLAGHSQERQILVLRRSRA